MTYIYPTPGWVRDKLIEEGYESFAARVNDWDCWRDFAGHARHVPQEVLNVIRKAMLPAATANALRAYYHNIEKHPDIVFELRTRLNLTDEAAAEAACCLGVIEGDPDGVLAKVVLCCGDEYDYVNYCSTVQDNAELREALLKSNSIIALFNYCVFVQPHPDVRSRLLKKADAMSLCMYCVNVSDDDEIRWRMIALNSPSALYNYGCELGDRPEIRKALAATGHAEYCEKYCNNVYDDPALRAVAVSGKQPSTT